MTEFRRATLRRLLSTVLALAGAVAACSQPTPPPAPTATAPVIVATNQPPPPSPTIITIEATPQPSASLPPSPTAALEANPTAPPEATGPLGPINFPANVNPLTGLVVADAASLDRRPIAIKVSQFPRRVRPQSGLSLADLVFEHYAEAGVTRMTAVFLGNDAPRIGSIRSARLIDIVIAESYDALLVTSGSSQGVLNALARTPFYDRVIAEATGYRECPPLCRQGNDPSTDNLFASTADLWATADRLGLNGRQSLDGMSFFAEPPAGGDPVGTVHLDFQQANNVVEWRYDAASGRYARWVDTEVQGQLAPQVDALNNVQLTAANVVVLYANHVTSDIPEDFGNGGHCGYEIQVWGSGSALLFRNGQMYPVIWVRFNQADVIGFVGPDNQPIHFAPGNTWVEILNLNSPATTENGVFSARFRGPSQSVGCPVN